MFFQPTRFYSNERQRLAFGARLIWRTCSRKDDPDFQRYIAIRTIEMQTYFKGGPDHDPR